ncbi:autotransporter domain-containing protein [Brevundimonas aveniformis]|uniref:autotransporter domain-containing protein n=1 Tax=Brevundimonas aveniformis TaxID=370977 RepID=UPI002490A8BC|nr:autotransporter domain-containing protein [Brevundimonas aveniformis]
MRIKLTLAASTLALGLAMAGTASAQTYGRIITFGDSLSDNGNLYAATGNTTPTSPPYFQGRFSNGPVWTELLGWTQSHYTGPATGSYNGAFGGARADNAIAMPPGLAAQIALYRSAPLNGTFDADDLVTIWAGANDIFQTMPIAGGGANPFGDMTTASVTAASFVGSAINTVSTAGAGTVLVANLPNLGTTPQFAGTSAQALATHSTNVFNSALYSQLSAQAAAHPNTNIIFMDVNRAFGVLLGAPGRFGFSNVSAPCFNGVTVCATPDTYVFWDGVHPTAAGHRLVAGLATDYLYYGNFGAHSALQGEIAVRARADGLDAVTGRLGTGSAEPEAGGLYMGLTYEQSEFDARDVVPGGDMTGGSLIVGADGDLAPGLRAGAALQMRTGDAEVGLVNFTAEGAALDAYLGWREGSFFVNAAAGYSWDQYEDIRRQTATPGIVAQSTTNGSSFGAKVEGGMIFDAGGLAFVPRVGVSWISTTVDGYVEENAFGAQHQINERNIDAVAGEVVLRVEGDMGGMSFWGEGGYRDVLSHDADDAIIGLAGNTATPQHIHAEDPDGGQALLGAGLATHWGPAEIAVGYRGRIGESYNTHQGGVEVTLRF